MSKLVAFLFLSLLAASANAAPSAFKNLKSLIFAPRAKAGTSIQQSGKSTDGKDCTLTMLLSRSGIVLTLDEGTDKCIEFRASNSNETSSQFEMIDTDENLLEVNRAFSEEEIATIAVRQHLRIVTLERPGEKGVNNVQEIKITSQQTRDWWANSRGRMVPDFSSAAPPTAITCAFE
jgi:hypothetical protein